MKLLGVSKLFVGNLLGYVVVALGVFILTDMFWAGPTRTERDAWMAQAAINSELVEVTEGWYHRATVELKNEKAIRAQYEEDLPLLRAELRSLRANELIYIDTIAQLQSDTAATIAVPDTSAEFDLPGVEKYNFSLNFTGADVDGTLTLPSREVTGNIEFWPLPIRVVTSQLPDDSWRTDVVLPPWATIDYIDSFTVPENSSALAKWWRKNHKWLFLATGFYLGVEVAK